MSRIMLNDTLPAHDMFTSHMDKMFETIETLNEKESLNSEEYNDLLTSLMKMRNAFHIHNEEIRVLVEKNKEKTAKVVRYKSTLELKDTIITELQQCYEEQKDSSRKVIQDLQDQNMKLQRLYEDEKKYSQMVLQELQEEYKGIQEELSNYTSSSSSQGNEKSRKLKCCSVCNQLGHNKRTCPNK